MGGVKKTNLVLFLFFSIAIAVAFAGCVQYPQQAAQPTPLPSPTLSVSIASPSVSPTTGLRVFSINVTATAPSRNYFHSQIVEAREGESTLQVFEKALELGIKQTSLGAYVYSVQGINESSSEGLYWQYYFNDELAPVGVSDFRISEDGLLEWRLEEPKFG